MEKQKANMTKRVEKKAYETTTQPPLLAFMPLVLNSSFAICSWCVTAHITAHIRRT